jgi:hypothetical protein
MLVAREIAIPRAFPLCQWVTSSGAAGRGLGVWRLRAHVPGPCRSLSHCQRQWQARWPAAAAAGTASVVAAAAAPGGGGGPGPAPGRASWPGPFRQPASEGVCRPDWEARRGPGGGSEAAASARSLIWQAGGRRRRARALLSEPSRRPVIRVPPRCSVRSCQGRPSQAARRCSKLSGGAEGALAASVLMLGSTCPSVRARLQVAHFSLS